MSIAADLQALAVPIDSLQLLPDNPRKGDIEAVARSLAAFGQRKPIVARVSDRTITAGNHTLQAARSLGWTEVAVVWEDDDETTARAFALADNRTAELGGYDDALLAEMVGAVHEADADLFAATGWTDADLQRMLDATKVEAFIGADVDAVPEAPAQPITRAGDLWQLGPHRILCGDCRDFGDVERLTDGARVNLAFTSPPYAEQRTYDKSSGFKPIPPEEYVEWFDDVQANVRAVLADDGSWFVNIKPGEHELDMYLYVFDLVLAHVRRWGWHFGTEYCWERHGVPKKVWRRFKNQFEPVYQFALNDWKFRPGSVQHEGTAIVKKSAAIHDKNVRLTGGSTGNMANKQGGGVDGKTPTTAGEATAVGMVYPGNRLPTFRESHEATGHGAAFPVGLPAFFVRAYTDPGDVVYDPFMGSGSTLIAAEQEGRIGLGVEISPAYCDVICARYQRLTGTKPIRDGVPYDFTEDR